MFAMLLGAWPRVTAEALDPAALEALVVETVAAQVDAGMGVVTDGQVRWADPAAAVLAALAAGDTGPGGMLVRAWRATEAAVEATGAGVPAAQAIPGPYSLGRLGAPGPSAARERRTLRLAAALAGELAELVSEGCPLVVVEEPAAVDIGADRVEGGLFAAAQDRLLADVAATTDLHAMLAITGGSAAAMAPEWLFAAPYRSYLFDLVSGPDNWILVRAAPPERGIVCGALRVEADGEGDQAPLLVWAARYAASAGSRGLDRVGLANATPLAALDPAGARLALDMLGRAAALAALPLDRAVEAGLDPRTFGRRPPMPGSGAPKGSDAP
jgi:hypothetical protein